MADLQLARLRRERRLAAAAATGVWHPGAAGLPSHSGQFGPATATPPPFAGAQQAPPAPGAPVPPVPSAPLPSAPHAPSASPVPYPPYPGAVPVPAAGPVPADGRIAQVRAELDDLSRLLREQGGGAE
jgi:hypothetical protein